MNTRSFALALIGLLGCGDGAAEVSSSPFAPVDECAKYAGMGAAAPPSGGTAKGTFDEIAEPIYCVLDEGWGISESGALVTTTSDSVRVVVPLLVVPDDVLAGVEVTWLGAGGHATIPTGRPDVTVWRTDLVSNGSNMIAYAADPSDSVVSYQTTHTISALSDPVPVDVARYRYSAIVRSEYGDGALDGAVFSGLRRAVQAQ